MMGISIKFNHAYHASGAVFSKLFLVAVLSTLSVPVNAVGSTSKNSYTDSELHRFSAWVEEMKTLDRGPFRRLRWFCNDGSVLPPKAYACSNHGGGRQHGEYSSEAEAIRNAGFPIATFMVETAPEQLTADADLLPQMLVERFLIDHDNGWIFRKAQFYRGAVQLEDEQRGGQALLESLAAKPQMRVEKYALLREAVRLLPHNYSFLSLGEIRGMATAIAERDTGFRGMRAKIHGSPDGGDAKLVREHAVSRGKSELQADYKALAAAIDEVYAPVDLNKLLRQGESLSPSGETRNKLQKLREQKRNDSAAISDALRLTREAVSGTMSPRNVVAMLDLSLELERAAYTRAAESSAANRSMTRRQLIQQLQESSKALYGTGMITLQEYLELRVAADLIDDEPLNLQSYRSELRQLGMAAAWAGQRLTYHLQDAINHMAKIEPKARQYVPDRLRGSVLLAYSDIHSQLMLDANLASNVRQELYGKTIATGLRALNPGLARGVLREATLDTQLSEFDPNGIYLVPETLPELPPVAGILTASEGNSLSHVQLLARNLGIPNVVVADDMLATVKSKIGEKVVLAVSAGGVVRLAKDDFQWDSVFQAEADAPRAQLTVNTDKLNLQSRELLSVSNLRTDDSGRLAGPKAAKLGELMARFPNQVSAGLVIPFGVYAELLQQPYKGQPMQWWLRQQYAALAAEKTDSKRYGEMRREILGAVRKWFETVPLPDNFERDLRAAMTKEFGRDGSFGVFVRSDTNVEDLPGFSGAGLNLTVPNVSGFDNILAAIRRVWASPFTERAFSWRQGLMDQPEHVYASVLLHKSVNAEKSGVLVTADVDSGNRDVVTVVVNEGVGGGVEGQLAETLKINLNSGKTRRLSTATATQRRVLLKSGGSELRPTSGAGAVLSVAEIEALRELSLNIPQRISEFANAGAGERAVADVEFGFNKGKLWLFQIRPLVENEQASFNRYLNALDASLMDTSRERVDLDRVPLNTDNQ